MSRNVSGKVRQDDVGAFNEQRQYNCPLCGRACVCVRLNLFPAISPVFATLYWECDVCKVSATDVCKVSATSVK